jgi:hypothetical protein
LTEFLPRLEERLLRNAVGSERLLLASRAPPKYGLMGMHKPSSESPLEGLRFLSANKNMGAVPKLDDKSDSRFATSAPEFTRAITFDARSCTGLRVFE